VICMLPCSLTLHWVDLATEARLTALPSLAGDCRRDTRTGIVDREAQALR